MVLAHSFDVFDTCLVRRWPGADDVLHAAAERAVPGAPEEFHAELARRRRVGEEEARRARSADAVSLEAIYEQIAVDLDALGIDPDVLHRAELETELDGLRPVRAARERIADARARGLRVLFLSDMYLPGGLIRAALAAHGMAQDEDRLYVSGDVGLSKFSGALFGHVLEQEGLRPHELLHHGDDAITDDAAPARIGIPVAPMVGGKPNRYEATLLSAGPGPRLVKARIAGLSRQVRVAVAEEDGPMGEATALAADVVAPLFSAFVAWLLQEARATGVERLYFVSRDAQVLLAAAEAIRRPGDPECRYLYGSRQAWFLPGVRRANRDSLAFVLWPPWGLRSPRAALRKLDIDADDVEPALRLRGLDADHPLDDKSLERLWLVLDDLSPMVEERAALARRGVLGYMAQEGVTDGANCALVDIGWNLSSQRALRRALESGGPGAGIHGYYLGVSQWRGSLAQTGRYRALLREDHPDDAARSAGAWVFRNASLIEQVFAMADHGSCAGYDHRDGRWIPRLRALDADPRRDALRRRIHQTVVEYTRVAHAEGLFEPDADAVLSAALAAGAQAIEQPTRKEAAALAWVLVGDDQNDSQVRSLADPVRFSDLARKAGSRLGLAPAASFDTDSVWRAGSLALSPPPVRGGLRSARNLQQTARDGRATLRRSRPMLAVRRRLSG